MYDHLLEQHADEAAFLWTHRDFACGARHPSFDALSALDERLAAHLDGLRIAGEESIAICQARLPGGDPGELFVAAALAAGGNDPRRLAEAIDRAAGTPHLERALVSALGWVPFAAIERVLPVLLSKQSPAPLRRLGVAACAAHRRHPGPMLAEAIADADPRLRARALRAAGELGRAELLGAIRLELSSDDEACRYWAAWSATLLGDTRAALALSALATSGGEAGLRAADLALRRLPPAAARERIEELRQSPEHARLAVAGAAALGDLALVPQLIEAMRDPALARLAGEAFTTITGIEIAGELVGPAPESAPALPSDDPGDEDAAMHPDELLPWPSPLAVQHRYEAVEKSLSGGGRLLCGRPLTPASLQQILGEERQSRRVAAALELALQATGQPLFAVCAPGFRQRELLREGLNRAA
jgi:uncharacterized protein (TIGR02270 family)